MWRAPLRSWAIAVALSIVAGVIAAALVANAESGPRPAFLDPDVAASQPVRRAPPGDGVHLAGSGSNLPLTRRLVAAFAAQRPDARIIVHESIGSTGGIRAVRDGVIDVGLVSRPLDEGERRGLRVLPYARVAVVVAAHGDVPDEGLSRDQLLAAYAGELVRWSDGSPMVVLQRERGDSSHRVFEERIPEFARVNEDAWRRGRFRVLYSDAEMQAALVSTPGAVGLFDLGAIRSQDLPLRALTIDGVSPTAGAVASGRYPYVKELAFVLRGEPSDTLAAFLDFVAGEEGRAITRRAGYEPLPGETR